MPTNKPYPWLPVVVCGVVFALMVYSAIYYDQISRAEIPAVETREPRKPKPTPSPLRHPVEPKQIRDVPWSGKQVKVESR